MTRKRLESKLHTVASFGAFLLVTGLAYGCAPTVDNKPAQLYDPGKETEQKAIVEKQQADAKRRMAERMPPPGALPPGVTIGGPPPNAAGAPPGTAAKPN